VCKHSLLRFQCSCLLIKMAFVIIAQIILHNKFRQLHFLRYTLTLCVVLLLTGYSSCSYLNYFIIHFLGCPMWRSTATWWAWEHIAGFLRVSFLVVLLLQSVFNMADACSVANDSPLPVTVWWRSGLGKGPLR